MTGEQVYGVWREAMNAAAARRGNHMEPRWKDLKPWVKQVWNNTAEKLA